MYAILCKFPILNIYNKICNIGDFLIYVKKVKIFELYLIIYKKIRKEKMKLFILGNGFDLKHKLPTQYNPDFYNVARWKRGTLLF